MVTTTILHISCPHASSVYQKSPRLIPHTYYRVRYIEPQRYATQVSSQRIRSCQDRKASWPSKGSKLPSNLFWRMPRGCSTAKPLSISLDNNLRLADFRTWAS